MTDLNCEKILYLLPLYIEGKTDDSQNFAIEQHLANCSECFEKYIVLKNISQRIKIAFKDIKGEAFRKKFFEDNLSAFVDNELSKEDYYAFSGYIALNPEAKKETEEMISFEKKIKESLENKKTFDTELTKTVINKIKKQNPYFVYEIYMKAIAFTVLLIILSIFAGYFSVPENWQNFVFKAHF